MGVRPFQEDVEQGLSIKAEEILETGIKKYRQLIAEGIPKNNIYFVVIGAN